MSEPGRFDPVKVEGVVLGAAAGDALGWPQENRSAIVGGAAARHAEPALRFRAWERNGGGRFRAYRDPVDAGAYSDDTQLLLAVARACLRGGSWQRWLADVELPFWLSYQRGGGGAVLRAARSWGEGRPPWAGAGDRGRARTGSYLDAGGNGAAMRVAPHAVVTAAEPPARLMERCLRDGLLTHGHPRALVGALVYATGLRAALNESDTVRYGSLVEAAVGEPLWREPDWFWSVVADDWKQVAAAEGRPDPRSVWAQTAAEMDGLLRVALDALASGSMANDEQTLRRIGCFGEHGGAGTVTAAAALYASARSAARPHSGLLRTAFLRSADTDTLASMTGAVLGAVHGTAWLGGLDTAVQDADYLRDIARALTDHGSAPPDGDGRRVTAALVKRFTGDLDEPGRSVTFPDGREGVVESVRPLVATGRTRARRSCVRTHDGQSLVIDVVTKDASGLEHPTAERDVPSPAPGQAAQPQADPPRGPAVSPPAPAPAQDGRAAGLFEVDLPVADAARAAHFYLSVLGLPGRRDTVRVLVAGGLVLRQIAEGSPAAAAGAGPVCLLAVDDLAATKRRLGASKYAGLLIGSDDAALHVKDPDGHRLRVVQR